MQSQLSLRVSKAREVKEDVKANPDSACKQDDMTTRPPLHTLHPRRYFDASPTWFAWNKLTAHDVHALRTEPGFEGQNIYFYRNHPIRYVRLVGLIVGIDVVAGGKYILLALDDGSGACITVKITRREVKKNDDGVAELLSSTTVDNLTVHSDFALPTILIDDQAVDIGTVLRCNGTLSSFRNVRQLELLRVWIVKDTAREAEAWADAAKWKQEVLSKPWVLTKAQRDEIDENTRKEEKSERERVRRKREWQAKYGEKRRVQQEKREAKRKAEEVKLNMGALKGSHVIAAPWE